MCQAALTTASEVAAFIQVGTDAASLRGQLDAWWSSVGSTLVTGEMALEEPAVDFEEPCPEDQDAQGDIEDEATKYLGVFQKLEDRIDLVTLLSGATAASSTAPADAETPATLAEEHAVVGTMRVVHGHAVHCVSTLRFVLRI